MTQKLNAKTATIMYVAKYTAWTYKIHCLQLQDFSLESRQKVSEMSRMKGNKSEQAIWRKQVTCKVYTKYSQQLFCIR